MKEHSDEAGHRSYKGAGRNYNSKSRGRGEGGRGRGGKGKEKVKKEKRKNPRESSKPKSLLEQETGKVLGTTEYSLVASYLSISSQKRVTTPWYEEDYERNKQSDSLLGKVGSHMVHFL